MKNNKGVILIVGPNKRKIWQMKSLTNDFLKTSPLALKARSLLANERTIINCLTKNPKIIFVDQQAKNILSELKKSGLFIKTRIFSFRGLNNIIDVLDTTELNA